VEAVCHRDAVCNLVMTRSNPTASVLSHCTYNLHPGVVEGKTVNITINSCRRRGDVALG
jgi:hypothetical protein